MSQMISASVDILKEFRLRRWARQNYVSPAERSNTWHPVVLDEMQKKDRERDAERSPVTLRRLPVSRIVPLEPTDNFRLHPPQQLPEEPNYARGKKPVEFYILG